ASEPVGGAAISQRLVRAGHHARHIERVVVLGHRRQYSTQLGQGARIGELPRREAVLPAPAPAPAPTATGHVQVAAHDDLDDSRGWHQRLNRGVVGSERTLPSLYDRKSYLPSPRRKPRPP